MRTSCIPKGFYFIFFSVGNIWRIFILKIVFPYYADSLLFLLIISFTEFKDKFLFCKVLGVY